MAAADCHELVIGHDERVLGEACYPIHVYDDAVVAAAEVMRKLRKYIVNLAVEATDFLAVLSD